MNLRKYAPGLIAGGIILIYVLVSLLTGGRRASVPEQTLEEGRNYIAQLEQQDVNGVKSQITAFRKAERRKLMEEGKLSVWDMFEDYVVLGDSRAVGFYYYGFLEESRTLATGGATIREIAANLDAMKQLNPHYIFLCYGLNDVSIGIWSSPEEYVAEYLSTVQDLQKTFPDAQIIISSILIARDPAFDLDDSWLRIPEFNDALKRMAQENGIAYADNTELCEQYADMWDLDGIHVMKQFYPYWGANLISEVDDE